MTEADTKLIRLDRIPSGGGTRWIAWPVPENDTDSNQYDIAVQAFPVGFRHPRAVTVLLYKKNSIGGGWFHIEGIDTAPHDAFIAGNMPPEVYADWLEETLPDFPADGLALLRGW